MLGVLKSVSGSAQQGQSLITSYSPITCVASATPVLAFVATIGFRFATALIRVDQFGQSSGSSLVLWSNRHKGNLGQDAIAAIGGPILALSCVAQVAISMSDQTDGAGSLVGSDRRAAGCIQSSYSDRPSANDSGELCSNCAAIALAQMGSALLLWPQTGAACYSEPILSRS